LVVDRLALHPGGFLGTDITRRSHCTGRPGLRARGSRQPALRAHGQCGITVEEDHAEPTTKRDYMPGSVQLKVCRAIVPPARPAV